MGGGGRDQTLGSLLPAGFEPLPVINRDVEVTAWLNEWYTLPPKSALDCGPPQWQTTTVRRQFPCIRMPSRLRFHPSSRVLFTCMPLGILPSEQLRSAYSQHEMTNIAHDGGCSEDEASLRSHIQSASNPGPSIVSHLVAPKFCTIRCVFLLAFLSNFSYYCAELPLLRLVERVICAAYYENGVRGRAVATEIEETMCKIPKIQNDLALFMGYKTAFDAIPRNNQRISIFGSTTDNTSSPSHLSVVRITCRQNRKEKHHCTCLHRRTFESIVGSTRLYDTHVCNMQCSHLNRLR